MRMLVTGGCGFIGANFIYHILEAHPDDVIVNLDKLTYAGNPLSLESAKERYPERYTFIRGDIADPECVAAALQEHRVDAVVNFAAESHVDRSIADPAPFVTTNVLGTQNLLHLSHEYKVDRFVHISTDEVYGSLGLTGRFTEDSPLRPNSPYSASKAGADMLVRSYWKTFGMDAVTTRCSNNYGPFQFPEKLIPLMIDKAGRDEPLPVYGDGLNVRDWIYVEDHCRGVDLALRKGRPGGIYNFGGDAELANLDVVRAILRQMGKDENLVRFVKDRPGHDRRYAMDYSLAARDLGFAPQVDFNQGLQRAMQWYSDNAAWVEQVKSGGYREFMETWYGDR